MRFMPFYGALSKQADCHVQGYLEMQTIYSGSIAAVSKPSEYTSAFFFFFFAMNVSEA